jgi:hypothetical protein
VYAYRLELTQSYDVLHQLVKFKNTIQAKLIERRNWITLVSSIALSNSIFPISAFGSTFSMDNLVKIECPEDFELSNKPLQTHMKEILLKSNAYKGFTAGVTVR